MWEECLFNITYFYQTVTQHCALLNVSQHYPSGKYCMPSGRSLIYRPTHADYQSYFCSVTDSLSKTFITHLCVYVNIQHIHILYQYNKKKTFSDKCTNYVHFFTSLFLYKNNICVVMWMQCLNPVIVWMRHVSASGILIPSQPMSSLHSRQVHSVSSSIFFSLWNVEPFIHSTLSVGVRGKSS